MEELKDIEIIARYLKGILTDSEKRDVEERLFSDTNFQQTFEEVNEAILAVQLVGEDRVRSILKEEQDRISNVSVIEIPKPIKKSFILRGWLAAASVAVLAIAGYWLLMKRNEEPFKFQYKPNTWLDVDRAINTSLLEKQRVIEQYGAAEGEKLIDGLSLYQDEAFDRAAQKLLTVNLQNDTLFLYQANALIKANNASQAVRILEKISNQSPSKDEKDWYLSMAYLQAKDIDSAKKILTSLSENASPEWKSEALRMLIKLK